MLNYQAWLAGSKFSVRLSALRHVPQFHLFELPSLLIFFSSSGLRCITPAAFWGLYDNFYWWVLSIYRCLEWECRYHHTHACTFTSMLQHSCSEHMQQLCFICTLYTIHRRVAKYMYMYNVCSIRGEIFIYWLVILFVWKQKFDFHNLQINEHVNVYR